MKTRGETENFRKFLLFLSCSVHHHSGMFFGISKFFFLQLKLSDLMRSFVLSDEICYNLLCHISKFIVIYAQSGDCGLRR